MTQFDDSPHDLPPEHEADVSSREADALDARLNEIAHTQGRATAWSRFGPKRRSRMHEAAAVPDFAQAFHQRVEVAEAADAGFAGLDPTLWEQIMSSTSADRVAPRPTVTAPSATRPTPGSKHSTARPSASGPFWTGFANATLAVVLLLAAFGVWRVYERDQGGPPPTEPGQHSLAAQPEGTPGMTVPGIEPTQAAPGSIPSTPETSLVPTVATVDEAEAVFACDFSRDIPILLEVNESPIDATVMLLTRDGDVVLSCPEEPESIVLATNQGMIGATEWPGVVMTQTMNYVVGVTPLTYINLLTGEQVEVVPTHRQMSTMGWTGGQSKWAVQDSGTDASGDTILIDLQTFEVGQLASFFPTQSYPAGLGTTSSTNGSGVLAVGLCHSSYEEGTCPLYVQQEMPGAVLIVDGDLDSTHWIDVPDDLTEIQEMVLSPDGDFLALRSTSGMDGSVDSPSTIFSVIRTDTGAEVGRSEASHELPEMQWALDGEALVFIDDTGLSTLRTARGEVGRLLETSVELQDLRSTSDPATVLVSAFQIEGLLQEPPIPVKQKVLSINLQSGAVVMIDGVDISQNVSPWYPASQFLVMADERPMGAGPHAFRVVDAVSGKELGTLEDVEFAAVSSDGQTILDMGQVAATLTGDTMVISFGPDQVYLIRHDDDGAEIVRLPPPIPGGVTAPVLTLAPDGRWLAAQPRGQQEGKLRYVLDLTDAAGEWQAVPDDYPDTGVRIIYFARGTGD